MLVLPGNLTLDSRVFVRGTKQNDVIELIYCKMCEAATGKAAYSSAGSGTTQRLMEKAKTTLGMVGWPVESRHRKQNALG